MYFKWTLYSFSISKYSIINSYCLLDKHCTLLTKLIIDSNCIYAGDAQKDRQTPLKDSVHTILLVQQIQTHLLSEVIDEILIAKVKVFRMNFSWCVFTAVFCACGNGILVTVMRKRGKHQVSPR